MTTPTPQPAIVTASNPLAIDALRAVWRRSVEHYRAQALRFFGILGGLVVSQAVGSILAGKPAFSHLATAHDWEMYLLPIVVVAYRQWRPALGAKAVDSAPGVTIVPQQVGVDPALVAGPGLDTGVVEPTVTGAGSAGEPPALLDLNDVPEDLTP